MKKREKRLAFNDGFDDAGKLLLHHSVYFVERIQLQLGLGKKVETRKHLYEYWYCKGFDYRIRQVERDGVLSNTGRKSVSEPADGRRR